VHADAQNKASGLGGMGLHYMVPGGGASLNTARFSSFTVPSDQWAHVAVTRASQTVSFFINGKLDQQHSMSAGQVVYRYGSYDDNSVHIGVQSRAGWGYDGQYQGLIDQFCIFNRALSDQEIAGIYAAQAGQ